MGKLEFLSCAAALVIFSITICHSAIAAPCKGICNPDWWKDASEEKVQRELDSASYIEALRQEEWMCSCEHFLVDEARGRSWRRSPMHVISFTKNLGDMTHAEAINILL